jgi:hypothetical protein
MLEWVEVEPVHGARTWILCENVGAGALVVIDGDRVDDGDFVGDD